MRFIKLGLQLQTVEDCKIEPIIESLNFSSFTPRFETRVFLLGLRHYVY